MRIILLLPLLIFTVVSVNARPASGIYTDPALDELRIEIDDLKHALKTTQVELNLLEERIKKQDHSLGSVKNSLSMKDPNAALLNSPQINQLEKRILTLEKTLEKAANDLRTLSSTASQALAKIQTLEQDVFSHEKRLDEVSKLKGTLTTISKAISQKTALETVSANKTYRVKAGDNLEKIARAQHVTVESLRKANSLSNDKIVIGQELRIPDDIP